MLRGVCSAGGNSSFVLGHYAELLGWTGDGRGVDLAAAGRSLDLLDVRRLVVADQALFPKPRVSVDGVGLAETDLGIKLARQGHDAAELELPGLRCTAIAIEAASASGATLEAQPLIRATAWTTDGRRIASTLLAGWDDRAWPGAAVPTRKPGAYRARFDLDGARDVARVRLEDLGSGDALRMSLVDIAPGRRHLEQHRWMRRYHQRSG